MAEKTEKQPFNRHALYLALGILLVVGGGAMTLAYLGVSQKSVYIDQSSIEAPVVDLSPTVGGTLRSLNVAAGETIPPNTVVAQVGVELIKSTAGGLVISTAGDVGDAVAPGQTVVETIDPASLRVVGQLDENKGLNRIQVGDPVNFTVDAFGGQVFTAIVDEVSPTSNQSGVVFNISSQRQVQQFDVKARFDTTRYPQLKNGMSARMWVFVQ
jgi:multidrug resistance efflux pump